MWDENTLVGPGFAYFDRRDAGLQMNIQKIINLNCGETYHRSYAHNVSSCEIKA